jgi:hypothetical protein
MDIDTFYYFLPNAIYIFNNDFPNERSHNSFTIYRVISGLSCSQDHE